MAFRDKNTCETYGLRYARPDPERRADALSASQSVLKAHRYRWVSETLSKSKFAGFALANISNSLLKSVSYVLLPRRKLIMPEKSAPACPCALNSA
ncbi:hypothetical protein EOA27_18250 [Mesorhizobium sp. M2A.F.Ca.ET.037.01.1.1]|nr:hypothetical protein EJ072_27735 [Mesorhizobium sp. M2A.F.Ca.ET.046.03.2.1]RUX13914.1 hypothetical protein EOA27_18250 [Mesorhizobium sp. M2A.F.Ca.ET.037.01.1.1]RVC60901.1 hypothetical protein EN759_30175 [Mesorhizobium sp. M00.F.Ca.ET.038.03.1.1]RVC79108.1 hypothetical protein EN766_08035 [Mesorhizobium sp. M2A.F.Ca.ET.046.02.1.1]RWA93911.1 MAG: hypothetical protein EOQ31_02170 [Mesorhizobium sp.]RWX70844.1 hypothetical protein EOA24_07995 [Mesorhizobium sp. M2A.F.Ca.ET.039.01.1.1]